MGIILERDNMDNHTINHCIDKRKVLATEAVELANDNSALDDAIFHIKVIKTMNKTVEKIQALDALFFRLTDMVPPTEEEKQWRKDDRLARSQQAQNRAHYLALLEAGEDFS